MESVMQVCELVAGARVLTVTRMVPVESCWIGSRADSRACDTGSGGGGNAAGGPGMGRWRGRNRAEKSVP